MTDDDWLARELGEMTQAELDALVRWINRQGRPTTGKGQAVHHINGNPYDNRPENLRIVDIKQRKS